MIPACISFSYVRVPEWIWFLHSSWGGGSGLFCQNIFFIGKAALLNERLSPELSIVLFFLKWFINQRCIVWQFFYSYVLNAASAFGQKRNKNIFSFSILFSRLEFFKANFGIFNFKSTFSEQIKVCKIKQTGKQNCLQ